MDNDLIYHTRSYLIGNLITSWGKATFVELFYLLSDFIWSTIDAKTQRKCNRKKLCRWKLFAYRYGSYGLGGACDRARAKCRVEK